MLPEKYHWIAVQFEPEGDPRLVFEVARRLEAEGNLEGAATAYDRAYGLDPQAAEIRAGRERVLDQLAVVEHGIEFRYIPEGPFLMGSHTSEPDERPWHPVWLSAYWLSATPVSWATYCRLMDWEAPPNGFPRQGEVQPQGFDEAQFHLNAENRVRHEYCAELTAPADGSPPPEPHAPNAPRHYHTKPLVAVSWQSALELAERISTAEVRYGLPTEAQWEKGARGGLIGARHAWGDEPPSAGCCDFNRFHEFSIHPMTTFPPNGYGLYAVNGCVWEWTRDWYDRDHYRESADTDPEGPPKGKEKVLRGGSWADCADVVTVTFRMSRGSGGRRGGRWGDHLAPNIGFRLCRTLARPRP
jgi:formylglycine-generating enzyme required for sulfatase activity